MLKRIVRMEFDPDRVKDFLTLFDEVKEKISSQEGCRQLELCRDASMDNVYYTFSLWEKEEDLARYRNSEFFVKTWARTKVLFIGKPIAHSLVDIREKY